MAKTSTAGKVAPKKAVNPVSKGNAPLPDLPDDETGLHGLLESNIRCLYWVENHLVKALPKMVAAAGTAALQKAFSQHLKITKGHVTRLEKVFELLGKQVQSKKSDALEGLTMDGEHVIEETDTGSAARDTGLIMCGQLVENYEITAYTGIIQLATKLGHTEVADILSETLAEERSATAVLEDLLHE